MAIGIGIGIGIPSGALNSNAAGAEVLRLISILCSRATYCENKICTTAILKNLEAIK
tara:strand:+ start:1460 stop:1630 length:171 start_codon:yes stop_codon:yes gene_type:complete